MDAGLTCANPASLVIGSEIAVAPESKSPMYAIVRVFSTDLRAFSAVLSGSQPTRSPPAVASSAEAKLILKSPTLPPASRSASFWALTMLCA